MKFAWSNCKEESKLRIRKPEEDDLRRLIILSKKYASESDWAKEIPIAQIDTEEKAMERLFAENMIQTLVAEADSKLVGYIGVQKVQEADIIGYEVSYLVDSDYRGMGICKRLVNQVFTQLPQGIEVDAKVLEIDQPSMTATSKMGFELKMRFEQDEGVCIFTRCGEKVELCV